MVSRKEKTTPATFQSKVFLYWPAAWYLGMTYPALPGLSAYLRRAGVETQIVDLNYGYVLHCLSKKHFDNCRKLLALKRDEMFRNGKEKSAQFKRTLLAESLLGLLNTDAKKSDSAIKDTNIINTISFIINTIYEPTAVDLLQGVCGPEIKRVDDLKRLIENENGINPFREYLRNYLKNTVYDEDRYIFGISLTGAYQILFTYTLAKILKERYPNSKVVIGGAYLPFIADALKEIKNQKYLFKYVDAYVIGEGEKSFLQYVYNVEFGKENRPIAGTIIKYGRRYIQSDNQGCRLESSEFPVPDYKYISNMPSIEDKHVYAVEISRGCYWGRCTFCSNRRGVNANYRPVDTENIIASVAALNRDLKAEEFIFSSLAAPPQLLEQISLKLIEHNIRISWRTWVRIDAGFTEDRIELFKRAGCKQLMAAPDNFNDDVLSLMQKGTTGSMNKILVRRFAKHGLLRGVNVIIGFPGDSVRNIINTVEFAKNNNISLVLFQFYIPKCSAIADDPVKYGIKLLKTGNMSLRHRFRFVDRNYETVANKGIRILKQSYPLNVYNDHGLSAHLMFVDFSGGLFTDSDDIELATFKPYVPNHVQLLNLGAHYWCFDKAKMQDYDITKDAFEFLRRCNGRKPILKIMNELKYYHALTPIKFFINDCMKHGIVASEE